MKIGVVGNGMIVGMFLKDAALVEKAEIVSLCVRPHSLEKGKKIAEEHLIPLIETDYDTFLINPEIETVYIGIANLVHYEYAKKALEAGKHVILEKPFTVTGAQARELAAIAKEKQLFIWEAFIIPYRQRLCFKNRKCEADSGKLQQNFQPLCPVFKWCYLTCF